jgi:murein L,D-transpeptidase YafK
MTLNLANDEPQTAPLSGGERGCLQSRWTKLMSHYDQSGGQSAPLLSRKAALATVAIGLLTALSGCNDVQQSRGNQPLSHEMLALMQEKGVSPQAPMLIRAYKKEAEFEVWKMRPDGTYELLKTFPICRWSGQLGPKTHEGDRQSPEGFYSITPAMMNPNSAYYLSFNVGYPNAYDRAHGATGGAVMVHGVCSSAGCFSMTDAQIAEIYALARESFAGGQHAIQMQAYPFHLNTQNLAKFRLDPNMPFWRELKKGADHFEATRTDVEVGVCGGHYVFDAHSANGQTLQADAACPPLKVDPQIEAKAAERQRADDAAVAELVAQGTKPVRLVYQDGGQHPAFAHRIAEVSRPETLTEPLEIALDDPRTRVGVKASNSAQNTAKVAAAGTYAGKTDAGKATAGKTSVAKTATPQPVPDNPQATGKAKEPAKEKVASVATPAATR